MAGGGLKRMSGCSRVGRVGSVMRRSSNLRQFALGADRRVLLLRTAFCAVSIAVLTTVFAAPAPALDSSDQRPNSPSAQLPIFKNPRAALQAGLESYHA